MKKTLNVKCHYKKEKTPFAGVSLEVASMNTVSNTLADSKQKTQILRGGVPLRWEGAEPSPFPSLSKGTLKSTSHNLTSNTPIQIFTSMTKRYFAEDGTLKSMKFFVFKYPKKPTVTDPEPKTDFAGLTDEAHFDPKKYAESMQRSIARTRREMNDIAECNEFDKFATFTFDPKKHNAYDRDYCKKKMIQWLNNQQKLHGSFRYLMVTEPMKDGKIHFHALLGGFTGKYHATNTRGKGDKARQCYKIDSWENSNGFADMEDITNTQALVNYIVKYISKDISNPLLVQNAKRYYASKNLIRPTKTYNETLESFVATPGSDLGRLNLYENDYVAVYSLPLA